MKKKYQKPGMTVTKINTEQLICQSGDNGGGSTGGWARELIPNDVEK